MATNLNKIHIFIEKIEDFMTNDVQAAIGGKANFLAALGLLDYTEILGGIVSGNLIQQPKGWSKEDNFKAFLPYLDKIYLTSNRQPYQELDIFLNKGLYGKVRSGLVHQYLLNQPGEIRMTEWPGDDCGIKVEKDGSIVFIVTRYFCDLRYGLTVYKEDLLQKQSQDLIDAIRKIPMGNI